MDWWLISDEDVKKIRQLLRTKIVWPNVWHNGETLNSITSVERTKRDALYILETGLHESDEGPGNFQHKNLSLSLHCKRIGFFSVVMLAVIFLWMMVGIIKIGDLVLTAVKKVRGWTNVLR